jgi:hypothetical protein
MVTVTDVRRIAMSLPRTTEPAKAAAGYLESIGVDHG